MPRDAGSDLTVHSGSRDIEEIDIRIEKETIAKIDRLQPEIVINLAAYTQVDDCESQAEKAFAVNAEGMRHVALGAVQCRAKVVYLSTDYVFDGRKGEPYVEDDPPHPLNVYGQSKWKGEQYVQELTEDALIVRTQWLYGKHGNNFVTAILRQAKREEGAFDRQRPDRISHLHGRSGQSSFCTASGRISGGCFMWPTAGPAPGLNLDGRSCSSPG